MKETGVIRRIDELGRIVVPKEIRRRLRIRTGDQIDISVSDNNIILNKYEPFNDILKNIESLALSIYEINKVNLAVFDNNVCIYSNILGIEPKDVIDDSLLDKLMQKQSLEISNNMKITITDNYLNGRYTYAKVLMANYEFLGVVLLSKDSILLKSDIDICNIISNYLSKLNEY